MRLEALDHVALWVAERDDLAAFLTGHLGMHVIERTDAFTLVGADARHGKLTLFAAEGPRDPGLLARVVLRVADLERAVAALPDDVEVERSAEGTVLFTGPEGLGLGLVESAGNDPDYDIDHVILRVSEPDQTFDALAELGFDRNDGRLVVQDKHLGLEGGNPGSSERPLLNHLALRVASADEHIEEARARGLEIADIVDAPNTYAVFVWGPERIKLEYVEHKPGFSLV